MVAEQLASAISTKINKQLPSQDHITPAIVESVIRQYLRATEQPTLGTPEWHRLADILPVFDKVRDHDWLWAQNSRCKYVELRIDMRNLSALLKDRDGNYITPDQLLYQYEGA